MSHFSKPKIGLSRGTHPDKVRLPGPGGGARDVGAVGEVELRDEDPTAAEAGHGNGVGVDVQPGEGLLGGGGGGGCDHRGGQEEHKIVHG